MELITSIEGSTVGEVLKRLNQDIIPKIDLAQLNEIIDNYPAPTYVKKLIKTSLIEKSKSDRHLLELLTSGDLFYIKHALKCRWFFKDSNNKLNTDFLHYLFDNISFTTRIRVIKRYLNHLNNPGKCIIIYKFLQYNYGFDYAVKILPGCGKDFIKQLLYDGKITLNGNVAKQIYNVNPTLMMEYIEFLLKEKNGFNSYLYEPVFINLITVDSHKFIYLWENYDFDISKLGRRLTKRIATKHFNNILADSSKYCKILHLKTVYSLLKTDFAVFYENLLPNDFDEFINQIGRRYYGNYEYLNLLKFVKNDDLFLNSVLKKYKITLEDLLDHFNQDNVKFLPIKEKITWATYKLNKLKLNERKEKHFYLRYLPPETAISELKEIIRTSTEQDDRKNSIRAMFYCAHIHKNNEILRQVCDYVVKRHRNDLANVRGVALQALSKNDYNLKHATDKDIWLSIEELINIFIINNEINDYSSDVIEILKLCILNKMENNDDETPQLELLFKLLKNYYNFNFNFAKRTKYERKLIVWFMNKLLSLDPNSGYVENFKTVLFEIICTYNIENPENPIEINDKIINLIMESLKTSRNSYYSTTVTNLIKNDDLLKSKIILNTFPDCAHPYFIRYILENNPDLILKNMPTLVDKFLSNLHLYRFVLNKFKFYLNVPLVERCLTETRNIFIDADTDDNRREVCVALFSILMSQDEFINFIVDFYPVKENVEIYDKENIKLYRIQCAITRNLKYSIVPYKMIEFLHKFVGGDYLKLVVGSLISIFLRTPQKICVETMKNWMDCRVSLRKHLFRLLCVVGPIKESMEIILKTLDNEKNVSLRIVTFNNLFKLFNRDVNAGTWEMMKTVLPSVNVEEIVCFTDFLNFNIENFAEEIISDYFNYLIKLINKKYFNNNEIKTTLLMKLVRNLNRFAMSKIGEETFELFLNEAYSDELNDKYAWNNFFYDYLITAKDESQEEMRLNRFFQIFCPLLKRDLSKKENRSVIHLDVIENFIDSLFVNGEEINLILLKKFERKFVEHFPPKQLLYLSFLMTLHLKYKENENDNLENLIKCLYHFFNDYYISYGPGIFDLIWNPLSNVFDKIAIKNSVQNYEIKFKIAKILIDISKCQLTMLMCLNIIPSPGNSKDKNYQNLYWNFIRELIEADDPVITALIYKRSY